MKYLHLFNLSHKRTNLNHKLGFRNIIRVPRIVVSRNFARDPNYIQITSLYLYTYSALWNDIVIIVDIGEVVHSWTWKSTGSIEKVFDDFSVISSLN